MVMYAESWKQIYHSLCFFASPIPLGKIMFQNLFILYSAHIHLLLIIISLLSVLLVQSSFRHSDGTLMK